MIFSSHVFLFLFLPLTILVYYQLGKIQKNWPSRLWLVIASLVFYGWFNWWYLILMLTSILVNFGLGKILIAKRGTLTAKLTMWFAMLLNIGLLGYFKYTDFFISTMNFLVKSNWMLQNILLPLGISFFTFQQLAYIYELYTGKLKENYSFLSYSLFICYFPQLIAGPIVLPEEMMPQFDKRENLKFHPDNFAAGAWLFSVGMVKKLIIADFFAPIAAAGLKSVTPPLFGDAWIAALAFMMQVYFDFSAYSDMAVGLGRMFNIILPINFDSPYKTPNIQEFWRTWHITLGRFMTTFIYFPLGGSKKGVPRTLLNLFMVALVCGLWHGAGWLFVLWGSLHGMAMVVHRIWSKVLKLSMPYLPAVILSFLFQTVVAVVIGCANLTQLQNANTDPAANLLHLKNMMHGLFVWTGWGSLFLKFDWNVVLPIIGGLVLIFAFPNAASRMKDFRITPWRTLVTVVFTAAGVLFMSRISPFIYFNF